MTRVVISECFGGFSLSVEAIREYLRRTGREWTEEPSGFMKLTHFKVVGEENWYEREIPRDDPVLVAIVEEMGEAANGGHADLSIVEVPDDVKWHVHEYDGFETLHEDHRIWSSSGVEQNC